MISFRAFECELRSYAGDDPLDVYVRYITWTEQNYLQSSKESNLVTLLEKCVIAFKDFKAYHDDERYIQIWVKLVSRFILGSHSPYGVSQWQCTCTVKCQYSTWQYSGEIIVALGPCTPNVYTTCSICYTNSPVKYKTVPFMAQSPSVDPTKL